MPEPIINRKPTISNSPWERAYQLLQPLIIPTLILIPGEAFTFQQFITYLRATNPGEEAYQLAVSGWKENLTLGRQTVHGQILPQLLRESGKVEWGGYIYDEPEQDDGLSVPTFWIRVDR